MHDVAKLNEITLNIYEESIEKVFEHIKDRYEAIVIESYSDVSLPWRMSIDPHAVLAIEPWRIVVYDPSKYVTAARLYSDMRQNMETTVSDVARLCRPISEIKIKPTRRGDVVDYLLDVVKKLIVNHNLTIA